MRLKFASLARYSYHEMQLRTSTHVSAICRPETAVLMARSAAGRSLLASRQAGCMCGGIARHATGQSWAWDGKATLHVPQLLMLTRLRLPGQHRGPIAWCLEMDHRTIGPAEPEPSHARVREWSYGAPSVAVLLGAPCVPIAAVWMQQLSAAIHLQPAHVSR